LLARSDQTPLENAPIPPGTAWVRYEYSEPDKRESRLPLVQAKFAPADYVQFAVGGHVFPPKERWIKVTERFRGRVLAKFEGSEERYRMLAGKDRTSSEIVSDHSHAYFILWPDEEDGYPTRLIVWRRAKPFDDTEIRALLESAQTRVFWEDSRRKPKDVERREDWAVRLVPLPMQTPLPHAFFGRAAVWRSATPFVPPWSRHRFRRNGKERKSESPEEICARLIEKIYGVRPDVEIEAEARWTKLHEPVSVRNQRRAESARTPLVRPGFFLRLRFAEPLQGPVIAGDSSHFGLGVFRREG
jgi:CRISPR-associated protein Csb2